MNPERFKDLNVVNLLQSHRGSLFTNTEDFTGGPHGTTDGRYLAWVALPPSTGQPRPTWVLCLAELVKPVPVAEGQGQSELPHESPSARGSGAWASA